MKLIIKTFLRAALVFYTVLFFFLRPRPASNSIIVSCIFTSLVGVVFFLVYVRHSLRWKSWLTPSILLLFSLFIVYYQWVIDYQVGLRPIGGFLYPNLFNHSVVISTIGFLAFIEGYTLKRKKEFRKEASMPFFNVSLLVFLQVILFVLFVLNIKINDFLSGNYYSDTPSQGLFTYIEYFLQATIIAILIASMSKNPCHNNSFRSFLGTIPVVSFIIVILYLVLRLFSGDRGPVIYTLLAFFFSYLYYSKKQLSIILIILLLIMGSYSVSLIGMARKYDTSFSFSDRLAEASKVFRESGRFDDYKSISPSTQELAFSHLSYEIMIGGMLEDHDGYRCGAYQAVALGNTIPFFSGFLHNRLGFSKSQTSSSYYATYKYIGDSPSWGVGTNCMGDFFMDFGILGVLLGMLVVGFAFRRIDLALFDFDKNQVSYGLLAFSIVYASKSLYIARSSFMAEIKFFVFVLVLLWGSSFLGRRQISQNG